MSPRRAPLSLGLLLLVVAAAASAVLVAGSRAALPGCGPESACRALAAGPWGRIPGLGWPTSHVGLAWFVGLAAAWALVRGRFALPLYALALAGGAGSLVLLGVMLVERSLCPWCLAVHAANLCFLALLLRAPIAPIAVGAAGAARPLVAFALAAGGTTLALVLDEHRAGRLAAERAEAELADLGRRLAADDATEAAERAEPAPRSTPVDPAADAGVPAAAGPPPFTGRWRLGPERAAVRVVVFVDYQCPDCRRLEQELARVVAAHDDVSVSVKHFPMCSDCNDVARALDFDPHPEACHAALAAEAAGLAGGNEAFWAAHRWLFAREGRFTDAELLAAAVDLGLERDALERALADGRPLERVRADVAEGASLGLRTTPMVFFNGKEWRGWSSPAALPRAVEVLLGQGLAPRDAAADRPPDAWTKALADWHAAPRRSLRSPAERRWLAAKDAPQGIGAHDVVLWGDYQEANTRELDAHLRRLVAERPGLRYSYRHWPIDQGCNELATRTVHPAACVSARVAEAAGLVGGEEAFWRMHAWLMEHEERGAPDLRAAAREQGLDVERFWSAMRDPAVEARIDEDALDGRRAGLSAVPMLLLGGRHLQSWRVGERLVVEAALDELLGT